LALFVSACENTLIYAERTGFNLGIAVNDDPSTPVHVNAGLKRTVVSVVPPRETGRTFTGASVPKADSVSMFSGFRLQYDQGDGFFQGNLRIRTQFASGQAAINLADDVQAVRKIVNVNFSRDVSFVDQQRQKRVDGFLDDIDGIADEKKLFDLNKNPPVTAPDVEQVVKLRDPSGGRFTDPDAAKQILKMRVVLSKRSDADLNAWEAALKAQ